jgi:hypothetical protein
MPDRPDFDADVTDLRALLGAGPPVTEPDEAGHARLAGLGQAIMSGPRARPPGRLRWPTRRPGLRPRRRMLIISLAVPALLAATAAGWALAGSPPAIRVADGVACYMQPYLLTHGHPKTGGVYITVSDGASPIAVCRQAWAAGDMGDYKHRYVPRTLVACGTRPNRNPDAISQGTAAVLPDTTCAAVHLPRLPRHWERAAHRIFQLENALRSAARGCRSEPAMVATAQRILAQRGFTGWVVTTPWGTKSKLGNCWEAQDDSSALAVQVLPKP